MNKYVFFIFILLSLVTFFILIRRILSFYFIKNLPKLYIAIGLNIFLFLLITLVVHPFFKTNDDTIMWLYVMGKVIVDQPTEYIQFMNVLLGKFLKNIYIYFPSFNWYIVLFYTSLFSSYTYFSYLLQTKFGLEKGLLVYFICFFLLGISFLLWFQFSIVSGVLCSIGFFGVLVCYDRYSIVFGSLLCLLGSLVRFDVFLMVVLMMTPILLIDIKRIKMVFLPIAMLIVVCVGLNIFNNYLYQEEFSDFITQNNYRGKAQEYSSKEADSPELQTTLKEINWSKNDYDMFKNWFFSDTTLYNTGSYIKLSSNIMTYDIKKLETLLELTKDREFILFIIHFGVLVFAFSFKHIKKHLLLSFFIVAYMIIAIVTITFFLKAPPYRILMIIYLTALLNLLVLKIYTQDNKLEFSSLTKGVLILFLFLIGSYRVYSSLKITEELQRWSTELEDKINSLDLNSKPLIISWGGGFPFEYISLRDNDIDFEKLDVFALGTGQNTTLSYEFLEKRNIKNIYKDILTKNVLLFVEEHETIDRISMYKTFMNEHYNINPEDIKVDTITILFEKELIPNRFVLKLSR